jgi:hypothetical protein
MVKGDRVVDEVMIALLSTEANRLSAQGRIREAAEIHERIWKLKRRTR